MTHARLYLFALACTLILGSILGIASTRSTATVPPTADFPAIASPEQIHTIVAAAQQAEAQERTRLLAEATLDPATLPYIPTVYFAETGHHLSNRTGFLDFWRSNGQLLIFGYPITEEIVEDGRVVQYFERARFELEPESGSVMLGLLGREVSVGRHFEAVPDPQDGTYYVAETGHTMWGEFLDYWHRRGEAAIFGYPISQELEEDGRVVQYFERARFEYHPEDMGGYYRNQELYSGIDLDTLHEVRLSHLGRQVADIRGISTAPVAQLEGTLKWSPTLWERRIEVNLSTQWLTAYEGDLVVYDAPVATGRNGFNTPVGNFAIYQKLPLQTMQGEAAGERWNVPNIPSVMYIYGGVALHGTYWHNLFGSGARPSHGCINLPMDDAQWLYEWASVGTPVSVHY